MDVDMTKEEFYKKLIDIHKQHGQGLSGIVKASSEQLGQYLDEFIAEGLIIACDTGGSLGHPESNVFYMPTKGYNVWLDCEDSDGFSGRYLGHVRLYLGVQEEDSEWDISTRQLLQSPQLLSEYLVWLERNDVALKEMLALDDFYQAPHTKFSKDELEFWKTREWYEKNKTVAEIKKANKERLELNEQLVEKTNEILKLMSSEPTKYSKEIEKYEQDIIDTGRENVRRKKLNSFLNNHSNSDKIQSILN